MRPINIGFLVDAHSGLANDLCVKILDSWGITPKTCECSTLVCLVKQLRALSPYDAKSVYHLLDGCFLGFKISRISKEFDCLWIGEKTIVNIELKSKTIEEENIKKQLIHNRYYLRSLGKDIASFTFVAATRKCFALDTSDDLEASDIVTMAKALYDIHKEKLYDDEIDALFPPERFLVSPFNSPEDFYDEKYFLTNQQQEIKEKILQFAESNNGEAFSAITGGPGSGKTLLMYDIARTMINQGKKVVIGHSGGLNSGQSYLIGKGWKICSTKDLLSNNSNKSSNVLKEQADVYFIDEAQRTPHIDIIAQEVTKMGKKCVFSFDADQVMSDEERKRGNDQKILRLVGIQNYRLTSNIRTNQAVYEFVGALFDKRKSVNSDISRNVSLSYCHSENEAGPILEMLKEKGYSVPKFTPMAYTFQEYESWFPLAGQSAHQVIGQEFDSIAALLTSNMYYDSDNKLVSRKTYHYEEDRMLYQILSRARRSIHLVIANNPIILERCLKLINGNMRTGTL